MALPNCMLENTERSIARVVNMVDTTWLTEAIPIRDPWVVVVTVPIFASTTTSPVVLSTCIPQIASFSDQLHIIELRVLEVVLHQGVS